MPDHVIDDQNSPELPRDAYEQEIDELWQKILSDPTNESLHQHILILTKRYFLFDRVAMHYSNLQSNDPDNTTVQKFRDEFITAMTMSMLSRRDKSQTSWRHQTSTRIGLLFLFLILLFGAILASVHMLSMRKNIIAVTYEDGLNSLARGDLKEARTLFNRVNEMSPGYRDVRQRIAEIERVMIPLRKVAGGDSTHNQDTDRQSTPVGNLSTEPEENTAETPSPVTSPSHPANESLSEQQKLAPRN